MTPLGTASGSNVQPCQDEGSPAKDVIISQGIAPMEAGDTLEVLMSANHPEAAMCIEAIQPSGEPLLPSIIFSMIKQIIRATPGSGGT